MSRTGLPASIALLCLVCTSVAAAAGGYGPFTPPVLPGGPAAFESKVLAAKTFGRSGGRLSVRIAHSDTLTILVPRGALSASEQVAVTGPSLSELAGVLKHLRRKGFGVETGFALAIATPAGNPFTRKLAKPLAVTIEGANLGTADQNVLSVTTATASTLVKPSRSHHKLAFSLSKEADVIVVDPAGT